MSDIESSYLDDLLQSEVKECCNIGNPEFFLEVILIRENPLSKYREITKLMLLSSCEIFQKAGHGNLVYNQPEMMGSSYLL